MKFRDVIVQDLPTHFTMPEEFLSLADWMEEQGYSRKSTDPETGKLVGYGHIADPQVHDTADPTLEGRENSRMNWTGSDRIFPLGRTGGDGSYYCLWLNDDGVQQIVHLGSGSGSILWATLPSAMSILRLFSVGYFTPAFNDEWGAPPEFEDEDQKNDVDAALAPYRQWLQERWGQTLPTNGVEALELAPEDIDAWVSLEGPANDPFRAWLDTVRN